ncbi:MAG TPA: sugar-binding protein [Kiritimatiellia bacterium]|nr:sugar-binding protein [Kiritimatiellia bacterium]
MRQIGIAGKNGWRLAALGLLCVMAMTPDNSSIAAAQVAVRNPGWMTSPRGEVEGWMLHWCRRTIDDEGRTVIHLPDPSGVPFAKLSQRIPIDDPAILALTVTATVRARPPDAAQESPLESAPSLCIYYHGANTGWSYKEVLWPAGRAGAKKVIPRDVNWQTVSFDLPRPPGAVQVEIALEAKTGSFGLDVAEMTITALRSSDASNQPVAAEPQGPVDRSNLLAGSITRFEGGSAGWQVFVLPHYPAVQLEPEYDRAQPGEGQASIRIPPGAGLNSMPVLLAKGKGIRTLSFLARAEQAAELVVRQGYNHGSLQDVRVPVTREWTRVHATYPASNNQDAPFYFIENRMVEGRGTDVYIDAISLSEGGTTEYIEPPAELMLVRQPNGVVRADLLLAGGVENPGAWTWTLEEVDIESRLLAHGLVAWKAEGPQRYSATIDHPTDHGMYRIVLLRDEDRSIEPMQELLIAQASFATLPEFRDGGAPVTLGVHAHHNWARQGSPPRTVYHHPDWETFLRSLRTMGIEWMRFHGGRDNPTILSFAAPDGPRKDYLLAHDLLKPYQDTGFRLMAVLDVGFGKLFRREPWFAARETHGEWGRHALPEDMSVWTDFVRAMATAYADVFDAWEVVNEPNGTMQASDYMPLLKEAYAVLKEVVPDKPVLGVCATADYESSLDGFVEQCFALGAADAMDILSFHPYVGNDTPEASLVLMQNTARLLERSGAQKGLWNTEKGWSTMPTYISHQARGTSKRADSAMGSVGVSAVLGAAYNVRNILHSSRVGVNHYFIYSGMNPQFGWQAKGHFGPAFEYDGTMGPLYFMVGTIQRVLQEATFREAITLRDGGLWAYLYDFPDKRVLAALWTNERKEPTDLRSESVSRVPARGWDGMGRPLDLSAQGVAAGPMPTYFVWDDAETGDIANMITNMTWEAVPRFQVRVGPARDGSPCFEVRAANPLETSIPALWVPDVGPPLSQDVPPGSDLSIVSGLQGGDKHATLDGMLKIGATGLTRIQQRNRFHALMIAPSMDAEEAPLVISSAESVTFGMLPDGFLATHPIKLWLRATTNGLRIAFDVPKPDQTYMQMQVGASQINMDSVELFMRTRPDDVQWAGGGYQRGDIKISLAQDHRDPAKKSVQVDQGADAIRTEQIEFRFAARTVSPGYTGTVFIPWTALPLLESTPPATLGFDLSFNMADVAGVRRAQVTWSGPGFNWLDPSGLGVLRLTPAPRTNGISGP